MNNSTDIKLSIIIVCLNSEKYIGDTLQSLIGQTYQQFEVIVVDGKSNDKTLEIIEGFRLIPDFKNKIRLISEPDSGIYNAMNKGIGIAVGDFIYFLNSDDVLCNNHVIDKIMRHFKENIDILYGDIIVCNEDMKIKTKKRFNDKTKFKLLKSTICFQTVFIRKNLFNRIGLFNEEYCINSDYDWLLRAFNEKKIIIKYIDLAVAYYRLGGLSSQASIELMYNERKKIVKQNIGLFYYLIYLVMNYKYIISKYLHI